MRIKITGLCRNARKVYVGLSITERNPKCCMGLVPQEGAPQTPCSLLPLVGDGEVPSQAPAEGVTEFVAVLPDLALPNAPLSVVEKDVSGEVIQSSALTINFRHAKWTSRLNYRLHPDACARIRDLDERVGGPRTFIVPRECISHGSDFILRGAVHLPRPDGGRVTVRCTDMALRPVGAEPIYLGDARVPGAAMPEVEGREVQFSLRLPREERDLILTVSDEDCPENDSFIVLTRERLRELCDHWHELTLSAQWDDRYDGWFRERRATPTKLALQRTLSSSCGPTFSLIVPLFNTPLGFFREMVSSVEAQSYPNWELVLVNASPENEGLRDAVDEACSADSRVVAVALSKNLGISLNTNAGVAAATGDFVGFLDHDDIVEPDLLFEYASAIQKDATIDMLYCDEDKIFSGERYAEPFFKPDFAIDTLRSFNYICHLLCVRRSLWNELEPSTPEVDGAQDHFMTLQASEHARTIRHVPRILYHWRVSETSTAASAETKAYATEAGIRAVQAHLDRCGLRARALAGPRPFSYRIRYELPSSAPLVSVIIPNKDQVEILERCVSSILEKTTYGNYEIVIVENNSTDSATFAYYDRVCAEHPGVVHTIRWPGEFNFSKIVNFGAASAQGEYLLLLNNDTEVITSGWMELMLGVCQRPDVGAVGVRLFYPDDTIQHAGVSVRGEGPSHIARCLPRGDWGYYALADTVQDLSAVTAACVMVGRSAWNEVGGFTEELAVAFNDVDFCLKLREAGYLVVYDPEVELYHYESLSRGGEIGEDKQVRFHNEVWTLKQRWTRYFTVGDPYVTPNVTNAQPLEDYYHL